MTAYSKALAALAGAVAVTLAAATSDDVVTSAEVAQLVVAALTAFGVYLVPNAPGYRYAKAWTAAALAGVSLLAGWLANGQDVTTAMWLNVAIAVGTSLGVFILPNDQEAPVPSTAQTPPG